jgi:hypothetical protein
MNHKTPEAESHDVMLARVAAAGIMLKLAVIALSAFPYKVAAREGAEREIMLQMFTDILGSMVPRAVRGLTAAVMCLEAEQSFVAQHGGEDLRDSIAWVVDEVLWLLPELLGKAPENGVNTAGERMREWVMEWVGAGWMGSGTPQIRSCLLALLVQHL